MLATKFHIHTKQRAILYFYISWSLTFWIANLKTKDYIPNNSKHSQLTQIHVQYCMGMTTALVHELIVLQLKHHFRGSILRISFSTLNTCILSTLNSRDHRDRCLKCPRCVVENVTLTWTTITVLPVIISIPHPLFLSCRRQDQFPSTVHTQFQVL